MQKNYFTYPVEFAGDVFGASPVLAEVLKKVTGSEAPRALIVADMNVVQRTAGLGTKIGRYVREHGIVLAGNPVVLAGGEKVKADNLQGALKVITALLSSNLGRADAVLALGGGAILDVAGYAASQVRGGVKVVRLPTTPAAMLDAAYADYAAVDSATVKDALRVACAPAAVVIDVSFARTVLDAVWRSGIAEALRQAVAVDAPLLKKVAGLAAAYRGRDVAALGELVRLVAESRARKGGSALSQWAAQRLEAMSGYKLPHGYALAIALCVDLGYAVEKGCLKPSERDTVTALLGECEALDGLLHSAHLLGQTGEVLKGLDAWALATGSQAIPALAKLGKTVEDESPDREALARALAGQLPRQQPPRT